MKKIIVKMAKWVLKKYSVQEISIESGTRISCCGTTFVIAEWSVVQKPSRGDRLNIEAYEISDIKIGQWILRDDFAPYEECSVCGYEKSCVAGENVREIKNYCPNCGAKMEVKK